MKKYMILCFAALSFSLNSQEITNKEGSNYKFEKIAHLDATPVESQGRAGTCWSFSALSFFESELIRKGNKNPQLLSEMYIVRKAYESKADKYIRMDGKVNFSQGGAFHDIPYVIKRYGILPANVYKAIPEGMSSYNHSEMFAVLNGAVQGVKKQAGSTKSGISTKLWKQAINGILDTYIGKDIQEFEMDGKKYTPKTYADKIGLNMDDYISLTSFTNHPMNSKCMLAIQDNWSWGNCYNVNLDDLYNASVEALKNGYTLAWGADVSEKGFSFSNGLGIIPEDESTIKIKGRDNRNFSDGGAERSSNAFLTPVKEKEITAEYRQKGYDNKTTTDDHGMHIVGLYKDQDGTNYFLVKNSWGTGNYPEGYLYVSESYFKWKTINIYLHKGAVSKGLSKKIGL
jgi:bleomycin hydrolase